MQASDAILKPLLRTGARKWMLCVDVTHIRERTRPDKSFAARFPNIPMREKKRERERERERGRAVSPMNFLFTRNIDGYKNVK